MTSCRQVNDFLAQVRDRSVSAAPPSGDTEQLAQLGLVTVVSPDQFRELTAQLQAMAQDQAQLAEKQKVQAAAMELAREDQARTHSILFHLHPKDKQQEELQQAARDTTAEEAAERDVAAQQQAFNELLAKRALVDSLTACGDGYVGLTARGTVELRNLGVRLYRYADVDFASYWAQGQRIDQSLNALADHGADYFGRLAPTLFSTERPNLWGTAIGLAKAQPDPAVGTPRFEEAYSTATRLSSNPENCLMASEILFSAPQAPAENLATLQGLVKTVRQLDVAADSALGIAAMLLFGRRADGTFATNELSEFLGVTRSYEAAALLALMNEPATDLATKFQYFRSMFASWGYEMSEDVELSSAYLTVSEIPPEGISTKLAIIAKGMGSYLEYPLVASSVLASIATLEANETLNLLEQAYGIVGRRATGLQQGELICLAVRTLDGIRNELVGTLDATATVAPGAARAGLGAGAFYGRPMFLPLLVAHNAYFSTYSGVAGAHPAHVHALGGGGGVGGGG